MDLPLGASMLMSSEMALTSIEQFIAELIEKEFLFAISLLSTTIQDGGMKEVMLICVTVFNATLYCIEKSID